MTDNIETNEGVAPILYVFANRQPAPELEHLLSMFYMAAYTNTLGVMHAFNTKTDTEEVVLVGVAVDEEGKTQCFPIAKVLAAEDAGIYFSPTGTGGFYDPTDAEAASTVRESMKPVDESLVDVPLN